MRDDILMAEEIGRLKAEAAENFEQMQAKEQEIYDLEQDIKSAKILSLLDKISLNEVKIESFIADIEADITNKQEGFLQSDQPYLHRMNFSKSKSWGLSQSMKEYYKGNVRYLQDYLSKYILQLVFHILFIGLLVYFFIKISKTRIHGGAEEGGVY